MWVIDFDILTEEEQITDYSYLEDAGWGSDEVDEGDIGDGVYAKAPNIDVEGQDFVAEDFGANLEDTVLRSFIVDGRSMGGLCDVGVTGLNEYLFQVWRIRSEMCSVGSKDGFFARNVEDYILMLLTTVDFNKYRDYIVARNYYIGGESVNVNGMVGDRTRYDRTGMFEFDGSTNSSLRISDTVEFVARHLFKEGNMVTYRSGIDDLINGDDSVGPYDSVFLTECLSKGLNRLGNKMVEYNQEQTMLGFERLFSDTWTDILKSGVLVDWTLLFEKYVEWKKDLGFFSFKKFLRRMGVLRKLKIDEQTKAVKEVFPWIKADEIKSRRLVHPSLIRTVVSDSDGATFDLHSYDYDGYYARDNQQGPIGVDVGFVEEISRRSEFDTEMSLEYLTTKRKPRKVKRKPGRPRKLNSKNVTGARAFNVDYLYLLEQNAMNRILFGTDVIDGLLERLEAIDDSELL